MAKRSHRIHKGSHRRSEPRTEVLADTAVTLPVSELAASPRTFLSWLALALAVLCAGLYTWTADFPMVFDDVVYLHGSPGLERDAPLAFSTQAQAYVEEHAYDPDLAVNRLMRPLAYKTFQLNHLWDGLNPRWYRMLNVVMHFGSAWLIAALVVVLGRRLVVQGRLRPESVHFIAAASSILFAVHPLATESVTYVIQRFTSMGTLFLLLSLVLYFASFEPERDLWRITLRSAAVIALLAGHLTKENTAAAPVLAVLLDALVLRTGVASALRRAWPLLLCLPLVPAMVYQSATALNGGSGSLEGALNLTNCVDKPIAHLSYILTETVVVVRYLGLLLWPAGQNLLPEQEAFHSFTAAPVLASTALLLGLLASAFWLWKRHGGRDARAALAGAGVLWFFATISISSGLVPLPDFMAEHRTYLPSIGLFVLAACALDWARWDGPAGLRRAVPVIGVVAATSLATVTCLRNTVWGDARTLWADTVVKSPRSFKAWNNLGVAHMDHGDLKKAEECFHRCLEIEPFYQHCLTNLSQCQMVLNHWDECYETTSTILRLWPDQRQKVSVSFALGVSLAGIGRVQEGVQVLEEVLRMDPDHVLSHKVLGILYSQHQQTLSTALNLLKRANTLAPGDPQVEQLIAQLTEG